MSRSPSSFSLSSPRHRQLEFIPSRGGGPHRHCFAHRISHSQIRRPAYHPATSTVRSELVVLTRVSPHDPYTSFHFVCSSKKCSRLISILNTTLACCTLRYITLHRIYIYIYNTLKSMEGISRRMGHLIHIKLNRQDVTSDPKKIRSV